MKNKNYIGLNSYNDKIKYNNKNFIKYLILLFFFIIILIIISMIILFFYFLNIIKSQNNKISFLIKNQELLNNFKSYLVQNGIIKENSFIQTDFKDNSNNISFLEDDKDMIGLKYPMILYDQLKIGLIQKNITFTLIEFLRQLEIKLFYLEKEINVTKLNTFYNIRDLYLKKRNIKYDDSNIKELHNIISWLVIHKSTQLKGIASDKYLACKYVKLKLGINLCEHRIGVYNNVNEINFNELIKIGNIVLKISNGCHDLVYIYKDRKNDINKIKSKVTYYFNREYNLIIPEFFHFYSKKRIIVEKIFIPFKDLYEFKFFMVNRNISFIKLSVFFKNKIYDIYYDKNFDILLFTNKAKFDIFSIFEKKLLSVLSEYAYKLSEDFPNFIRVDLYIFHNKIYLSELTFDSYSGIPLYRNEKFVKDAGKNWKRID